MASIHAKSTVNRPLLLLLVGMLFTACESIDFLPIQGAVEGIITNNNGEPLAGIQVTAAYEAASPGGEPFEEVGSIVTDQQGFYRLTGLWDEVQLTVKQPGFQPVIHYLDLRDHATPVVDLELVGSPTISSITFDRTILSAGSFPDSVISSIEVLDVFNSIPGDYRADLLLLNAGGAVASVFPAFKILESQDRYLFQALITSAGIPKGVYQASVEVHDPDGNSHRVTAAESLHWE